MGARLFLLTVAGFIVAVCNPKESRNDSSIAGIYVREYSFQVTNSESGKEIGMRTIRDTVFVRANSSGYMVSNSKWSLNDYDKAGWKNMKHSDDRPIAPFQAKFDKANNTLISPLNSPLFLDIKSQKLFKEKNGEAFYQKTN
jgi:hypothetical protein